MNSAFSDYGIKSSTFTSDKNDKFSYARSVYDKWAVVVKKFSAWDWGQSNNTTGLSFCKYDGTDASRSEYVWRQWLCDDDTSTSISDSGYISVPRDPKAELRQIIRERQKAPHIITSRKFLGKPADMREERARETLRRVIGDDKFRSFLRNGFISVRAKSGKVYQIFPGHQKTVVYENGVRKELLCVVLQGNFPPTDELITRFLMILNNEEMFRSKANVSEAHAPNAVWERYDRPAVGVVGPLTEVYKRLKIVA